MTNEITLFNNEEFGSVRAMSIDGEPWFVGKDVTAILGYANQNRDIVVHVDEEDRKMFNNETRSHFGIEFDKIQLGQRGGWLINESGLYSLILRSKLESAKKFKRWITAEVLPSIRKTGGYINSAELMIQTYFADAPEDQKGLVKGYLNRITDLQKKNTVLNNENQLLINKKLEWADRPLLNSLVRAYGRALEGNYAQAWVDFKKEILYKYGINLNLRITNHLNESGKKTEPKTLDMLNDSELPDAISTAISLCREKNVDIDDLLQNKAA